MKNNKLSGDLQGKVVIVTGASGGIGRAAAIRLAQEGMRLTLAARRKDVLDVVAEEVRARGGTALPLKTDITQRSEIQSMLQATLETWGRVDVLINNAGIEKDQPFATLDPELIQQEIATNLVGSIDCAQLALQVMLKQGSGHIINIASLGGLVAIPRSVIYSTTKFGLVGFSDALRRFARPYGVQVTTFCPGYVATDLTPDLSKVSHGMPTSRSYRGLMQPEYIAEKLTAVIRKPRGRVILPSSWAVLIIAAQLFPGLTDRMIHLFE